MLSKAIQDLTIADFEQLIENEVFENRVLEYKRELPNLDELGKPEFLKDISAFANTSGGYILYGIAEAKGGKPTQLQSIKIENVDELKRRLQQILDSHLEPKLTPIEIRAIKLNDEENQYIIAIYVQQSWNAPHRVRLNDKFYGRNSSGVFQLDTFQLRQAFNLSEGITQKINQFQLDPIIRINANDAPVPLHDGAKIILHIIPLSAFTSQHKYTQTQLNEIKGVGGLAPLEKFSARDDLNFSNKFNLEGLLSTGNGYPDNVYKSYTQVYRNGIIEAVQIYPPRKDIPGWEPGIHCLLPSSDYEKTLLKGCKSYIDTLKRAQFNTPIYIFLSLTDVKDFHLAYMQQGYYPGIKFDRNVINLPSEVIESSDVDLPMLFKPLFDIVWNACGLEGSYNYDVNGVSNHSI